MKKTHDNPINTHWRRVIAYVFPSSGKSRRPIKKLQRLRKWVKVSIPLWQTGNKFYDCVGRKWAFVYYFYLKYQSEYKADRLTHLVDFPLNVQNMVSIYTMSTFRYLQWLHFFKSAYETTDWKWVKPKFKRRKSFFCLRPQHDKHLLSYDQRS